MSGPAFGFSVGDFIACASLVRDVIAALNDATGSKAEFRALIETLASLGQALNLSYAVCMQWNASDSGLRCDDRIVALVKEITDTRERCIELIKTFLAKVQPFHDSFVAGRGGRVRQSWRKISWLFKKDDAKALNEKIQNNVQILQVLTNALLQ